MLNFIYWPISWVLRFWHEVIGYVIPKDTGVAWILAIVLLTCTVRLLLLKPMVNQMRSTRKMQEMQPRMQDCLLYTSPSPRDRQKSRMPSSA